MRLAIWGGMDVINLVYVERFQLGRVLWGNGDAFDVLYGVDGV